MASMTVTLRAMTPADVPSVAALERAVFTDPWSEASFAEEVGGRDRVYLVAEDETGTLLGYGGLLVVAPDAHITTMAVSESFRGRGMGARLMLALIEAAAAAGAAHLTLEVRTSNEGARRLYRRFGFHDVGVRKAYYRDEDAIVMWAVDIDGSEYQELLREIEEGLA